MDSPSRMWQRLRAEPRRRDRVDAIGIGALGFFLISVGLVDTNGSPWDVPTQFAGRWWHAIPLTLGCLMVLGRRRHPLTMVAAVVLMVVVDTWLGGSIAMYVLLADLLYTATLNTTSRRVRAMTTTVAVLVVGSAAAAFIVSGNADAGFLIGLQCFALLGIPVWWGVSVRQQSELASLASSRAGDVQRLADMRKQHAVREERTRMAKDLHDALSSDLSTIAIHSSAALADQQPADSREQTLGTIRQASVNALRDLRTMILLLQTGDEPMTTAASLTAVEELIASARANGLNVELHGDPEVTRGAATVDHAAYRIIQESLTNAAKHAPGSHVALSVLVDQPDPTGTDRGALMLQVASRSSPASQSPNVGAVGTGLGLITMRERAIAAGGSFSAGWSRDPNDRHWVVAAKLPFETDETPR